MGTRLPLVQLIDTQRVPQIGFADRLSTFSDSLTGEDAILNQLAQQADPPASPQLEQALKSATIGHCLAELVFFVLVLVLVLVLVPVLMLALVLVLMLVLVLAVGL